MEVVMQIIDPCYAGMTGNTAPALCAIDIDVSSSRAEESLSLLGRLRRAATVPSRLIDWYQQHRQRARERRVLACLDDRMLKDIGLSRADAEQEIAKGFWRA
jgi:uncharacterized protein YjiS (DUF1127 family)